MIKFRMSLKKFLIKKKEIKLSKNLSQIIKITKHKVKNLDENILFYITFIKEINF